MLIKHVFVRTNQYKISYLTLEAGKRRFEEYSSIRFHADCINDRIRGKIFNKTALILLHFSTDIGKVEAGCIVFVFIIGRLPAFKLLNKFFPGFPGLK